MVQTLLIYERHLSVFDVEKISKIFDENPRSKIYELIPSLHPQKDTLVLTSILDEEHHFKYLEQFMDQIYGVLQMDAISHTNENTDF